MCNVPCNFCGDFDECMISNENKVIQVVVSKNTYKFIKSLAKYSYSSVSKCANKIIENTIFSYSELGDKDFVEVLQKYIKELNYEKN